ncbi:MAG TPA: hypothetical protein VGD67_24175, partial [Pseudonocardiaceae bacterium]
DRLGEADAASDLGLALTALGHRAEAEPLLRRGRTLHVELGVADRARRRLARVAGPVAAPSRAAER